MYNRVRFRIGAVRLTVAAFLLTTALLLLIGCQGMQLTGKPSLEAPILVGDEKVEMVAKIATDRIGVLTRDIGMGNRLARMLKLENMALVKEYSDQIYVFKLEENQDRQTIRKLARELMQKHPKLIKQAGMVFTPAETKTPLIVTEELVVQFKPTAGRAQINALNTNNNLRMVKANPYMKNQYLLAATERSNKDALEISRQYSQDNLVQYAHPNYVVVTELRETIPNDPMFADQWHHRNTGQNGGTVDADIDTPLAWDITMGNNNVVIAVIDNGFDTAHGDLTPNLWTNPGEVAGNNVDDDGNGQIDDINGWDFNGDDNTLAGGNHGTAVAGCAGARGDNGLGVSGSCPNCQLLLIRNGNTVFDHGLAFGYAQQMGADIITNSWGYAIGTPTTLTVENAINTAAANGRGGLGCVVLFAMRNGNVNDCTGLTPDISSLNSVISVSGCSNQDRKVTESAFGDCMDVLAPTHRGYGPNPNGMNPGSGSAYTGTLNIVTTDISGANGYNNASPMNNDFGVDPTRCTNETANRDYTYCFGGTSAATPITAGVTGLVLAADPTLTRMQVQQLLQDSADKIQDSLGQYDTTTAFSTPAAGAATHGYGRINAFEAVRTVASSAGGRSGIDVFIRDNRLDWGNTEQLSNVLFEPVRGYIGHYRSADIKVDAPPYQVAPTTSVAFDAFVHENPIAERTNRVYVRVHNRGPKTASNVTVKLHWTFAGTALPALPPDFWTQFPANSSDTTIWHPRPAQTINNLPYCGASVAGTMADAAEVLQFDFPAPPLDMTRPAPRHYCLFVVIDSQDDPVLASSQASLIPDYITPRDNNVTHRNLQMQDSTRERNFQEWFYVRNPYRQQIRTTLRSMAPRGWEVTLNRLSFNEPFLLQPNEEVLVQLTVRTPKRGVVGSVTIKQEMMDQKERMMTGGLTYEFAPSKRME